MSGLRPPAGIRWLLLALLWLLAGCQAGDGVGGLLERGWAVAPTPFPGPTPAGVVNEITLLRVAQGLRRPVALTHAGDERFFAAEQAGQVRVIVDGRVLSEPFLDVSDRISTDGSERGLLGLAFHPDYAVNGWFYVVFTDPAGDTVLARYQVDPANPNQADPASETVILYQEQPYGNHNGGPLLFGPDGYFYVGLGDGGAVGDPFDNAQDPNTLLGAILRLDVDGAFPYAVPPDNPFVAQANKRGEVWLLGFRNPWHFSFDRLTGDLYVTDVGQDGWEEVNFVPAGAGGGLNYGWPIREGYECYEADTCQAKGLQMPVMAYDHSEGCAIIGGYVYRGTQFPELAGNYFYSDFCRGSIWTLRYTDSGEWVRTAVYETGESVANFAEDPAGELYVVFYRTGEVFQIQSRRP